MLTQQSDKCNLAASNAPPASPRCCATRSAAYDNSSDHRLAGHRAAASSTAQRLCLRVERPGPMRGGTNRRLVAPARLGAAPRKPRTWSCASPLPTPPKTDRHGFGRYLAADYDELADQPGRAPRVLERRVRGRRRAAPLRGRGRRGLVRQRSAAGRHEGHLRSRDALGGDKVGKRRGPAADRPLCVHAQRGQRRLRRPGAPPFDGADLQPARLLRRSSACEKSRRRLRHAAGLDQRHEDTSAHAGT